MPHTPGPWEIEHDLNNDDLKVIGQSEVLALVEYESDAAIIVAAPDMKDALTLCRDTLKAQMAENWPEEEWPQTVFYEAWQAATAAIAKAEAT